MKVIKFEDMPTDAKNSFISKLFYKILQDDYLKNNFHLMGKEFIKNSFKKENIEISETLLNEVFFDFKFRLSNNQNNQDEHTINFLNAIQSEYLEKARKIADKVFKKIQSYIDYNKLNAHNIVKLLDTLLNFIVKITEQKKELINITNNNTKKTDLSDILYKTILEEVEDKELKKGA